MTKTILRNCLREAKRKGQIGLLIWPDWTLWDEYAFELKTGNAHYDTALEQIEKGQEMTITFEWNKLSMPGILAIPVQKLLSSDEFFKQVLNVCEKNRYKGPVTLLPLNEVSDCF